MLDAPHESSPNDHQPHLLLPELPDADDACVDRLEAIIGEGRGISRAHIHGQDGKAPALCLHYDPDVVTLAQVERLATAAGLQITQRFGHAIIPFRLMSGEDAARRIETELSRLDGVLGVSVSLPAQAARVEFDRSIVSLETIEQRLKHMGINIPPRGVSRAAKATGAAEAGGEESEDQEEHEEGWYAHHKELVWSLIGGLFLGLAWAGERWAGLQRGVAVALYVVSYGFGGFDLAGHSAKSLRKGHFHFDIDLLMLLAALGAAVLGQWVEGAFLLFLFSFAHALEHFALDRARGAIRVLADLAPPVARILREGREVEVPVEQVAKGEVVIVRPAERIPVDGTILSGRSAVNQAPITGESVPVDKEPRAEVYAGTINGEGALEIETTRAAGDRTLDRGHQARLGSPDAEGSDPAIHRPIRGDLRARGPRGGPPPHCGAPAVGLLAVADELLSRHGAPRGGISLCAGPGYASGRASRYRPGRSQGRADQRRRSPGKLRHAPGDRLRQNGDELESVTARGVRSTIAGQKVEIGTLRLWEGGKIPEEIQAAVDKLQDAGRSIMAVRYAGRWLGVIGVADRPRQSVKEILGQLRALDIRPLVMLTGDNRGVGEALGKEVGVDEVKADLLPEDKVSAIKAMLSAHGRVAMVGDGVNDAPALAHATVGIAMGGAGTAVALETADVALMGDDLAKLPFAVGLSRMAKGVIRQNLYVSLGVIAFLILATTTGYFGIGTAVFVHEGSTLVVLANALRLLTYGKDASGRNIM